MWRSEQTILLESLIVEGNGVEGFLFFKLVETCSCLKANRKNSLVIKRLAIS